MKLCPSCALENKDDATECWKCGQHFVSYVARERYRFGPDRAKELRGKAIRFVLLGLVMKLVWGGYVDYQVWDHPAFAEVRTWLIPLFIAGGLAVYLLGWVLSRV